MNPTLGRLIAALAISVTLLAACSQSLVPPRLNLPEPATPTAPPATATPAPTADQAAAAFFEAWRQGQYDQLYGLLSTSARAAISQDAFVRRYTAIHDGLDISQVSIQALAAVPSSSAPPPAPSPPGGSPVPLNGPAATVSFQVTQRLALFGDLVENHELPLVQEQGVWRVVWDPGLIFNGLTPTSTVRLIPDTPARGRILDRAGQPLAHNGSVLTVGVVPGQIADEAALVEALADSLELDPAVVKQKYQGGQPDWFMPIADRPVTAEPALQAALGAVPGVALQQKSARVYPLGEAAAHLVGYLTRVNADDLKQLAGKGYTEDDWIGRGGLEAWGEAELAGQKGGKLVIVNDSGTLRRTVAERKAVPGSDLHLTVDATIQAQASKTLGEKTGSIILMDPRDNSLLALVSHPSFDPNRFVVGLTDAEWQTLNGPDRPLVSRASESTYPTGSTFKVVTMAAGLERGGFKPTDTFDCAYDWNGLPGVTLRNWQPQGVLSLIEALSQSCNPAFYTIGLKLDQLDSTILSTFAQQFGLGQPTGLQGIEESPGIVPDPAWKQRQIGQPWTSGDGVNLAIGQGYLLASPLQLANAYAALANGGTLRTPLLVKSINRADGTTQALTAQDKGKLPISPATRAAILEGLKRGATTPNGTAYYAFRDAKTPTAAKTGSAENENPDAHAWFAGFQTPDRPTTLAIVLVEGGQQGSTVAAPLGRQVLNAAFPLAR